MGTTSGGHLLTKSGKLCYTVLDVQCEVNALVVTGSDFTTPSKAGAVVMTTFLILPPKPPPLSIAQPVGTPVLTIPSPIRK